MVWLMWILVSFSVLLMLFWVSGRLNELIMLFVVICSCVRKLSNSVDSCLVVFICLIDVSWLFIVILFVVVIV